MKRFSGGISKVGVIGDRLHRRKLNPRSLATCATAAASMSTTSAPYFASRLLLLGSVAHILRGRQHPVAASRRITLASGNVHHFANPADIADLQLGRDRARNSRRNQQLRLRLLNRQLPLRAAQTSRRCRRPRPPPSATRTDSTPSTSPAIAILPSRRRQLPPASPRQWRSAYAA